jgi:putative toxin-antitoxin system antitoxin component (TIGR02293 family)
MTGVVVTPVTMEVGMARHARKFAEILAKATTVFGNQREAEEWLERPAIGLDQRRPIDLLASPAGARIVEDFLTQLEFGVYA